ncbi:MAG: SRPBCC family protein [Pseudomonadota bacterium]
MYRFHLLLIALLFPALLSGPAMAVEILDEHFSVEGRDYIMGLEARLDAAPEAVWEHLTNYDRLNHYSDAVTSSREQGRDGTRIDVESVISGCVAFFCKEVTRLERITEDRPHTIDATIDPDRSDLREGRTLWRLHPDNGGTRLVIEAHMVPDFWVPPLLGRYLIKRNFLENTTHLLEAVEAEAR